MLERLDRFVHRLLVATRERHQESDPAIDLASSQYIYEIARMPISWLGLDLLDAGIWRQFDRQTRDNIFGAIQGPRQSIGLHQLIGLVYFQDPMILESMMPHRIRILCRS